MPTVRSPVCMHVACLPFTRVNTPGSFVAHRQMYFTEKVEPRYISLVTNPSVIVYSSGIVFSPGV
jgi:hypothetical protein